MKKQVLGMLVAIGIAALAAPASSFAQVAADEAVLRAPFPFVAGDSVLPAGTYTVRADSSDPAVLWITSADGRTAVVVDTNWGNGDENDGSKALFRFRKYGQSYLLSRIAMPGEDAREIPLSKGQVERDLVKMATARYEAQHGRNG